MNEKTSLHLTTRKIRKKKSLGGNPLTITLTPKLSATHHQTNAGPNRPHHRGCWFCSQVMPFQAAPSTGPWSQKLPFVPEERESSWSKLSSEMGRYSISIVLRVWQQINPSHLCPEYRMCFVSFKPQIPSVNVFPNRDLSPLSTLLLCRCLKETW